jgi:zinc/manganese transport system substrate-binding protein
MERAVRVIEKKLIAADAAGSAIYKANAKTTITGLRQLDAWVKTMVATIPKSKRHLVTAHAAFGYFCKAYGFKATFIQGLSAKGEVPAQQLAISIRQLQAEKIPTVFPEKSANPKILAQIARQSGAQIGKPLIADGSVASYQRMIQTNVTNIVAGLKK